MQANDYVRWKGDKRCVGRITEVGSNLYLVKWLTKNLYPTKDCEEEWMPEYALEVISRGETNE